MKVLGIDNVFVPVGDFARAVEFYRDVLGFPVTKRFDQMSTALFQVGDETPGLGVGVADPPAGRQKVWFEVPDARAAAQELSVKGVRPLRPPFRIPTGWAFEIHDPWGNVLGFADYLGKPELGRRLGDGG
ncbi:VOC family protein [Paractinoplanes brasiliensis]|uniref:Putative enzyme related to lactoylglutathione lyase n=1 Tax=Paractinoplanes brasiliensis TaxID=52695 RepID=A0A4V3C8J7_9ACTN|nr:VOC family protein [Actinoplanes brasiliensis]TDO41888.1 putative enzyme related to lactoylglutathione lyase [Actinoplanes brasiliensis]